MKTWKILLGAGLFAVIAAALFENQKSNSNRSRKKKRVFISFAIEDVKYRNFLVSQSKDGNSPFEFVDMSIKEPWTQNIWKRKCRALIRRCDGVIALLSNHTWHAGGTRWEIKCAKQEDIPIVGMHIYKNHKYAIPPELNGSKVITWSWENLEKVLKKF